LTECLGLAGAGAALGIALAHAGQSAFASFLADSHIVLNLSLNKRVLLFSVGLSLLTGLMLGIVPALRAARQNPAAGLHGGARGVVGERGSMTLGRGLVVVQVALSMVLLAGAALFVRSLSELRSLDLGFAREGVLTLEAAPERALNGSPEWLARQEEILDRVRRIPGVLAAGWATMNPMSGRDRGAVVEVPGFTPKAEADNEIHLAAVSPGYFASLGMPLLLGRDFTYRDRPGAAKVAIVNESAARFYFGAQSPIGRKVRFTNYPQRDLVYEIAGVVGDIKHDSLREKPPRFIYLPLAQHIEPLNRLALAARCWGDPAALAGAVQERIRRERSTLLITNVSTMEKQIEQSLMRERLVAALAVAFGGASLVLAGIGLYGILAYGVARRRNELGIRMALGATRGGIAWLVLREALTLAAGGALIGVPLVTVLGSAARAALYGVERLDVAAVAGAAALLLLFSVLAAAGPGWRAGSLDPVSALRRE
jgi:predicted permease